MSTKEEKFRFKIPIGDWSGDGHEKCEWFFIESNKSVSKVREIHFRAREISPFSLEEICSKY